MIVEKAEFGGGKSVAIVNRWMAEGGVQRGEVMKGAFLAHCQIQPN